MDGFEAFVYMFVFFAIMIIMHETLGIAASLVLVAIIGDAINSRHQNDKIDDLIDEINDIKQKLK